jgi:hypothetical protein
MKSAAYLAGLIDGDGCIVVTRRDRRKTRGDRARGISYAVFVKVGGETGHIRHIKSLWGVGYIYIRKRKGQRHLAEWTIEGNKAKTLLTKIRPYLILKYPQAINAINFPQAQNRWDPNITVIRAEQKKRWHIMKILNSRVGRGTRRYHGSGT